MRCNKNGPTRRGILAAKPSECIHCYTSSILLNALYITGGSTLQDLMSIKFYVDRKAYANEQYLHSMQVLKPLLQPLDEPQVFISNSDSVVRGMTLDPSDNCTLDCRFCGLMPMHLCKRSSFAT